MKKIFFAVLFLLGVSAGAYYFYFGGFYLADVFGENSGSGGSGGDGGAVEEFFENVKDTFAGSEGSGDSDENSSGVSGGGASGGGSSGGSGDGGSVGECVESQISYALKGFLTNSSCLSFNEGVCERKIVGCYLKVHNLDKSVSGDFALNFSFYAVDSGEEFDFSVVRKFVEAGSFEPFNSEKIVESTGQSGTANKDLSCSFKTEQVPKKCI